MKNITQVRPFTQGRPLTHPESIEKYLTDPSTEEAWVMWVEDGEPGKWFVSDFFGKQVSVNGKVITVA